MRLKQAIFKNKTKENRWIHTNVYRINVVKITETKQILKGKIYCEALTLKTKFEIKKR